MASKAETILINYQTEEYVLGLDGHSIVKGNHREGQRQISLWHSCQRTQHFT